MIKTERHKKKQLTASGYDGGFSTGNGEAAVPVDAQLFINRELSLLEFNRRVLEEAQDESNPLLERVKFLSIVGSNMAEFFMVRVGGLKQQIEAGVIETSMDGLTPAEQLALIRPAAHTLMSDMRTCLRDLLPQLRQVGIHLLNYAELDETQRTHANEYFEKLVFPVLTPLAYDPGRPFPHISNMSLNLAVIIRNPSGHEKFARLKVPSSLPRLVRIPAPARLPALDGYTPNQYYFVWLEQVITANLGALFPGMEIVEAHSFRVTRDAEYVIKELDAQDLLETIERGIRERRFGSVVRVTIDPDMPGRIRDILIQNMDLDPDDIYTIEQPLGLSDLKTLYGSVDRYDLKDPPFLPVLPPEMDEEADIFAAVRFQDILLHHPYDSFSPVVEFLSDAARDPSVLAIKMTLYRVGRNSPVVEALLEAARNGKQVAVLVELKARFDEESNIEWAKALEREGVHVVYGLEGLKIHSKIALVVRKEGDGIRRYIHVATGNYNPITAQIYTDLGMFTCDEDMGADASHLFNVLTGYSAKRDYRKFLVAPVNLRARLIELIEREIQLHKQGHSGHLIFKINSLVDQKMIRLLYRASQAGVKIDLIVRGMCCLRPGLPGISETIRVTSIVGRFLEHTRIYYFRNGGQEEVYVGSADLMTRNLDRRIEVVFPIQDQRLVRYLRDEVLDIYMQDNVKARVMQPDGSYQCVKLEADEKPLSSQAWFLKQHRTIGRPLRLPSGS